MALIAADFLAVKLRSFAPAGNSKNSGLPEKPCRFRHYYTTVIPHMGSMTCNSIFERLIFDIEASACFRLHR
jgi:hypothetical protein